MKKTEYYVSGMHCAACELFLEKKLSKIEGINKVDAKLAKEKIYIDSKDDLDINKLNKVLENTGYQLQLEKEERKKINYSELKIASIIALLLIYGFIWLQSKGIGDDFSRKEVNYPFIFTIGLIASISSCMAVVGGLVLSLSANYAKAKNKVAPLLIFHTSRLVSFFILGGLIGLVGSVFVISNFVLLILSIFLLFVMLILGINLLEIFSFTKKLQIKIPKILSKHSFKAEGSTSKLAPLILGVSTFVLPCGFTLSMQFYSLETGSILSGATTMLVFALGTLPVLVLISLSSVTLSNNKYSGVFFKTAGLIVIFFAIFNFITSLVSLGIIKPIFNI